MYLDAPLSVIAMIMASLLCLIFGIFWVIQIRAINNPSRLLKAINIGNTWRLRKLLRLGAPVDLETESGTTPLQYAARTGRPDIAKLLISYNADINHADENGMTPLMEAAGLGHGTTVEVLLRHGADPLQRDRAGRTALTYAEENSHTDIRDLLLKAQPRYPVHATMN